MATVLSPVATATYLNNGGKVADSISYPLDGSYRAVYVYEVSNEIQRGRRNDFKYTISGYYESRSGIGGHDVPIYCSVSIVDNTLSHILQNDGVHLDNVRPGNKQNYAYGKTFYHSWSSGYTDYASSTEWGYWSVTTGRYIVVILRGGSEYNWSHAYVNGFSLEFKYALGYLYGIENTYPLEETINILQDQTFTWIRSNDTYVPPIIKKNIRYEKVGGSGDTITVLNDGSTSYTFPAFFFEEGEYTYYISEFTYDDILVSSHVERSFTAEKQYKLIPTYPIEVNIKNSIAQTFTWMREAEYFPTVIRHTIFYRKVGETEFDYLAAIDGNSYQEVPANTFDVDEYEYYIVEYGADDYVLAQTEVKRFNSVGQDNAPTITDVLNKPLTTVIWTASNQSAYELYIKDNYGNIIYRTDTVLSSQQYARINKFLTDGNYSVYVRIMNKYGIYSDWGSYGFVIHTSGHPTPSDVVATVTNKYGVEITGESNAFSRSTYVLRRKLGADKVDVIGIKIDGEPFIDYTAEGNTVYEYALRSYVGDYPGEGYGDSPYIPIEVKIKQVILQDSRDLENFIELYMSEDVDFNLRYSDERDRTLYNCLGRTYPVKESGEWISSVRTFTAYVTDEGYKKLVDIALNAPFAYFKGTGEYFACDLTIADQGLYAGGGRLVEFTLTRISDDSYKLEIEG